jgi:hypothetical protein
MGTPFFAGKEAPGKRWEGEEEDRGIGGTHVIDDDEVRAGGGDVFAAGDVKTGQDDKLHETHDDTYKAVAKHGRMIAGYFAFVEA